eukprot:TRINITY_DN4282_c0_g1_i1.p1 TRINITY_DN4282_c0_g1~~TRINITY_DN4282_c0_g1_i1.p1  ORF type:complete len:333 (+),score=51.46 TRINITY_DN4282_c0_g1_i1:117-1115(+)
MKLPVRRGTLALIILSVVAIGITVAFAVPKSPLPGYVWSFLSWMRNLPWGWQVVLFTAVQTVAVMLTLPATPFNLAAGSFFGIVTGSIISVTAIDISSALSFLIGRYIARSWTQRRMLPKFRAVDAAIAQSGLQIVFLIRLAPVFPYGLCSYLFGVTRVPFWKYFLATTAGMVPGTVAYTYMGTLMQTLVASFSDSSNTDQQVMWVIFGGVTTTAAIVLVTYVTKRALRNAMLESEATMSAHADDQHLHDDTMELLPAGNPSSVIDVGETSGEDEDEDDGGEAEARIAAASSSSSSTAAAARRKPPELPVSPAAVPSLSPVASPAGAFERSL